MSQSETLNSVQFPEFVNGSSLWENEFFLPIHQPQIQGNSSSGSEEINPMMSNTNTDERKLRRMISNRESARRSRMRKRKQLEDLQGKLNQLRTENRDILGRFLFVSHNVHVMKKENETLRSEHTSLIQKLSELRRLLLFRQIQCSCSANSCSNMACINEPITSSLIA